MSTIVEVRTPGGKTDGEIELPAEVFDAPANMPLMHQVVVAQLAAARQGTHSTKTRGDVRGGGRKPYRQKGTGRARQGSVRAPQFAGGGVVHGPHPRDYEQKTPKKMKAAALRGALSDRARAGRVHVVSALVEGDTPSTKLARRVVNEISEARRVLVVVDRADEIGWLSLRNLPSVHLIAPDQLNTYDVLVNDDVVFTTDALRAFLAGRSGGSIEVEPPARRVATTPTDAEATDAEATDAEATDAEATNAEAPYGPGSHGPLDDDEQPEGFPIKGNAGSMLYHVPGSSFYKRTVAEVWFADEQAAEAAGFELPPSQRAAKEDEK